MIAIFATRFRELDREFAKTWMLHELSACERMLDQLSS